MKTITDFPLLWSDLLQANRLVDQDFRDKKEIAVPLDLAVVSHSSNCHAWAVLYRREFVGIATWGATINTARGLSSQRLMGTLSVILLYEKVKFVLLSSVGRLGRNIVLKGSMHPFMASVLARLTWFDPFGTDAQLNPPLRQLADTARSERGKRCPVVGTNGPGQSVLSKGSFKPQPNHPIAVLAQGLAHQQITREIIGQRKRVTAPTVTQEKVSLKVRTPDLIRSMAVAKRFTVGWYVAPTHTTVDQPCTLEDLTGRRVRRPGQLRVFLTQIIQNLFRTPDLLNCKPCARFVL